MPHFKRKIQFRSRGDKSIYLWPLAQMLASTSSFVAMTVEAANVLFLLLYLKASINPSLPVRQSTYMSCNFGPSNMYNTPKHALQTSIKSFTASNTLAVSQVHLCKLI